MRLSNVRIDELEGVDVEQSERRQFEVRNDGQCEKAERHEGIVVLRNAEVLLGERRQAAYAVRGFLGHPVAHEPGHGERQRIKNFAA